MVGVRRKKATLMAELVDLEEHLRKGSDVEDKIAEVKNALKIHQYTITVNLVKNKRPGGGLVDDIDLELDTDTGRLYDLPEHDLPTQYLRDVALLREQRLMAADTSSTSPPVPFHQDRLYGDPDTKDF